MQEKQEQYEEYIKIEEPEHEESGQERIWQEEFDERQKRRREKIASSRRKSKRRILIIILIAFVLLATMCGRDIIRLKAENTELKKQQVALEKKRDELKEELKNTGESEYIREQARKQLKLLNPGEILFTFDDDE